MDKLKMHSPNLVEQNIDKLAALFPNCVTEAKDENGRLKQAIDFDLLRQELSRHIVDGPQERYQLNWPGKREALLTANAPIAKTLRPCREESVDFDTTRNLFIEGDNLDALKLLQETYLGKVKMIYIDPPYNTGNDFIYEDDFAEDSASYFENSKQIDQTGNRLVANTESNGRFHSDWLSMMFARLRLAKNLLRDDGTIFISIDDFEASNLKELCDEVFGSQNYYCTFVWKRRSGAMDSVDNTSVDHEYVLCYGKYKGRLAGIKRTYDGYTNPDNDPRGPWKADNLSAGKAGGDVHYPITDPKTGNQFLPPEGRYWPYSRKTMAEKIAEGRVIFPITVSGRPMLKRFKNEAKFDTVPVSTWIVSRPEDKISNSLVSPANTQGTRELQDIFGTKLFPHPKSTQLVSSLASQCQLEDGDIVLDFFAGSATTAHAILAMNANNGSNARFILVQIPEECETGSQARKDGFQTIADISKERIRRVGKNVKENSSQKWNKDFGFRVLKVASTNMADVYYTPDAVTQDDLFDQVENVKPDRSEEDLLFQVMLDWGVDLTLPIRRETIADKTVFFVDAQADNSQGALVACFDKTGGVDEDFIKQLAAFSPLRLVFRDAGFASDAAKTNAEQLLKQLSATTDVKTI
ncbi:site-specific DNA-methyltransferase [Lonsdalea quercina]|uniref:site-specific DNA-methyltransferase n=1 Tax=Lonsdalea quercina TaxID=71657 RepID=UPI003976858C